jgi:hypothetical protein
MKKGIPIGGILFLFAIGLIAGQIVSGYYFYDVLEQFLLTDFKDIKNEYGVITGRVVYQTMFYGMVSLGIMFIGNFISSYFFFTKRTEFVPFYIFFYTLCLFMMFVSELIANMIEYTIYKETLLFFISNCLWFTYLLKSERVKNTFVNKRRKYIKVYLDEEQAQ